MKRLVLGVMSLCVAGVLGCAPMPTPMLHPVTGPGTAVESFFVEGYEVAVSRGSDSVVALTGEKENQMVLALLLAVEITSQDGPIDFVPERIQVVGLSPTGRTKDLYVYAAHEYIGKLKASQSWGLALCSVASALQVAAASWSESTTTGTISGAQGSADVSLTTRTYDPAAGSAVATQETAKLAAVARSQRQVAASTNDGLLKANTLFPGEGVSGAVMVRYGGSHSEEFVVTVPVGDDVHEFTLYFGR